MQIYREANAERPVSPHRHAEGQSLPSRPTPALGGVFHKRPGVPNTGFDGEAVLGCQPSSKQGDILPSSGSGSPEDSAASAAHPLPFPKIVTATPGPDPDFRARERPSGRLGKQSVIPPTPSPLAAEPSDSFSASDFKNKRWNEFHGLKKRQWSYMGWLKQNALAHQHLETLKTHVSFKCRCAPTWGKDPGIGFLHGDLSWFGLMKCGSVWGCPICGPVLMKKHEGELGIGLYNAVAMGWTLLFLTQTIPHKRTDDMLELLQNMDTARELYGKGGTLSRTMKQYGHRGNVIRLEPTFGDNGIHPHTHTVLMFDRELTNEEIERITSYLRDKWKSSCIEAGLVSKKNEKYFDEYGFHCDARVNIEKLIWYMTKMEKGESTSSLAKEMTNVADAKRGRGIDEDGAGEDGKAPWGRSQWDVMRGFIAGDKQDTDLWLTFLKAFHRKSAIRWSPGLKKMLGVEGKEEDDAHGVKIDEEDKEHIVPVYQLPASQYGKVVHHGLWHSIIDIIDALEFEALERLSKRYQIDFVSQHKGYPSFISPETKQKIAEDRERQRKRAADERRRDETARLKAEREVKKQALLAAVLAYAVSLLSEDDLGRMKAAQRAHRRAKQDKRRKRRELRVKASAEGKGNGRAA